MLRSPKVESGTTYFAAPSKVGSVLVPRSHAASLVLIGHETLFLSISRSVWVLALDLDLARPPNATAAVSPRRERLIQP